MSSRWTDVSFDEAPDLGQHAAASERLDHLDDVEGRVELAAVHGCPFFRRSAESTPIPEMSWTSAPMAGRVLGSTPRGLGLSTSMSFMALSISLPNPGKHMNNPGRPELRRESPSFVGAGVQGVCDR
jgi:hypothetical protein